MAKVTSKKARPKGRGRSVLAVLADLHANYRYGLMNPDTVLWQIVPVKIDGGETREEIQESWQPEPTYAQQLIWADFLVDADRVKKLAGTDPVDLLLLADTLHGTHGRAHDSVSHQEGDDIEIALFALDPYLALPTLRSIIVVKGTEWHSGQQAGRDIQLAQHLKKEVAEVKVRALHHPLLKIGGLRIDAAHHGPTAGKRNWLRGNELGWYLLSLMQDDLDAGKLPPDLVLRAHKHRFATAVRHRATSNALFESRAVICPSYSFTGDFAQKSNQSPTKLELGMVAVEIYDGGVYKLHNFWRYYDLRNEVVLGD